MTCKGCKTRDEEIAKLEHELGILHIKHAGLQSDSHRLATELRQKTSGLRRIMEAYYRHYHSVDILDAEGFRREVDEALNESGTERWC